MLARLVLLLCLTAHVSTEELPDVDCRVVQLKYVECFWNKPENPQSNYTFYAWFHHETPNTECVSYLTRNGTRIGCNQPYAKPGNKFYSFYTKLVHGGKTQDKEHILEKKVWLYPPTNVTIQLGSDSNLWLYWNQTGEKCVESEVRYRINDHKDWDTSKVNVGKQDYCINLPCSRCKYEVQVRSKVDSSCGDSIYWSDWSEPKTWGAPSNNSTDVDCRVVQLKYVQCFWNKLENPQSNYTFYAWFHHETPNTECVSYLTRNGTRIGCNQPYAKPGNKFYSFYTKLVHGDKTRNKEHILEKKVWLYPPTNVTIQLGSDSNLWLYWNQTGEKCVESEVRYRINDHKDWDTSKVNVGKQDYCINLPCSRCKYEVQVRSKVDSSCGDSIYWSDWSEPKTWAAPSNNSTDVDCRVVQLKYVQCFWNKPENPQSNYTFYAWFHHETPNTECVSYLTRNGTRIGCNQPYAKPGNKFYSFYTKLVHGGKTQNKEHILEKKVWLFPPTNVTIQLGSDSNLWLYWNQTGEKCVESEVRYRINDHKDWDTSKVNVGKQDYCINLPCSRCKYEVQVRSKVDSSCGDSIYWSDWSEPKTWGAPSNNSTDNDQFNTVSVWPAVLTVVGVITVILMVIMLLHHDRLRIILIPVVPKPSLVPCDIKDWFEHSKGLKDSFKPNYNELACAVREYTHVSQSDSESLSSSTSSITTDQTDCSVFIPTDESGPAPLPSPQF